MDELIFKKADMPDCGRIIGIIRRAAKAMTAAGIDQWDELYPTAEIVEEDIKNGELTVVTLRGSIVAVYTLNAECDEQYRSGCWRSDSSNYKVIHRLCVDPEYQNRGIAKAAVSHIAQELRAEGCASIRLDVFAENPYALQLYAAAGYRRVGEASWRKGLFYLMEKIL